MNTTEERQQKKAEREPTQTPEGMTRRAFLADLNRKYGGSTFSACVGCRTGVRIWNQGSDYCERCILGDR